MHIMEQITMKHLERAVQRLNNITGNTRDVLRRGYSKKSELYNLIHAYTDGFELAQDMQEKAIKSRIDELRSELNFLHESDIAALVLLYEKK